MAFYNSSLGVVFIIAIIALYFLPTIVAGEKSQKGSVFVLNLFLGWTLIGWVVALSWAVKPEPKPMQVNVSQNQPTAVSTAVLCANCGKYSASDAQFCSHCGSRLAEIQPAARFENAGGIENKTAPKTENKFWKWLRS